MLILTRRPNETLIIGDNIRVVERVELRGFGVFSARVDPVRMVRNPKTGETRLNKQTYRVHFKPGKHLKERIISGYIEHAKGHE